MSHPWMSHPWKSLRPGWKELWATWPRKNCPCPQQGGWNYSTFKAPSNPGHYMILWSMKKTSVSNKEQRAVLQIKVFTPALVMVETFKTKALFWPPKLLQRSQILITYEGLFSSWKQHVPVYATKHWNRLPTFIWLSILLWVMLQMKAGYSRQNL